MTIHEIFRRNDEAVFRILERGVASRFTTEQWVVASGGGTLINIGTREILTARGKVVCLRVRPETLVRRLDGQRSDRPLLAGDDPLDRRITSLLEAREGVYSFAQWTLDIDELTPEQVADKLYWKIRNREDAQVS